MRGYPQIALIVLLIMVSLAIVLSSVLNRHDREEIMVGNTVAAAVIPTIDTITPTRTETATFALG